MSLDDSLFNGSITVSETVDDGTDANTTFYSPIFGTTLAMPEWEAVLTVVSLSIVIVVTVIGNILVIISVFTHPPLKITPNFFIVSLAAADLTVSIFVLPFNVIYTVVGRWLFPSALCKMWLTADVLCCTASILNLCAIALDRYQALHDPIAHAQRRSVRYVLTKILLVWLASCIICMPPLVGWNDWPDVWQPDTPCTLTEEKGYIVYSSSGSFFIPLIIIIFVYIKIFLNTRQRLRKKAAATGMNALKRANSGASGATPIPAAANQGRQVTLKVTVSQEKDTGGGAGAGSKAEVAETSMNDGNGEANQTRTAIESSIAQEAGKMKVKCRLHGSGKRRVETRDSACGRSGPNSESDHPDKIIKSDGATTSSSAASNNMAEVNKFEHLAKFINEKAKISLAKERKAARTMTIIVLTFVVCWLPFFLMYVILPFCGDHCYVSNKVAGLITWLGYVNSTLNPIIYTIFNMDFRVAFTRIMTCKAFGIGRR